MSKEKKAERAYKSVIIHQIMVRYFLTVAGYIAGLALFVFLSWLICRMFIWTSENPVYRLLVTIKYNLPVILIIMVLAGWAAITYRFMRKPLRYLEEVIEASEKLASPTDEQIMLSDNLKSVQDELNLFRETALRNAQIAREAEQRKNDLIVYLAHDLKTPLTSVIGYLTLLRDEQQISDELRQKYLSISLEKAERLEDLINEFFEITRFNLSAISLEYSRVNMTRLLEQLVFEFQPMLKEKNLECELAAAPDISVNCDADKMQRVFDNLLRNAVNYSFENESIYISAEKGKDHVTVRFTNKGNTIPKEKLGRIFEQFYRLDTARSSKSGGAGLGLAIAKEIVEKHGGTIAAASENEKIEFTVTLPV